MNTRTVFSGIKMNWLMFAAGMFLLSIAAGASAEEVDRPCVADAKKLCKNVQPGDGRIARCMKEHQNKLSSGCRENMAKAKEKIKDAAEACKEDAGRLCKGVEPGQGRILACLKQHEGELSAECKDQMKPPRGRR